MRELLNPALPEVRTPLPAVPPPTEPQQPSVRAPRVERIARWSARHRIAVIVGWLVLGAAALLAGQLLGTQSQPQYDPGQAGQAEQTLHQLGVVSPPAESVLIQARAGSPGYAHDPAMRGAVADVVRALHQLPGPSDPR